MIAKKFILLLSFVILIYPIAHAQEEQLEEESAAVSLEDYTDEFQEKFFEALKQKGIENYDKAINLFLACKNLDPDSDVVDHELAKVYFADKKNMEAQEYASNALISEPGNFWFLSTLVMIMEEQGSVIENIKDHIPFGDEKLQHNLALLYYRKNNYKGALTVLESLRKSTFTEELMMKIRDSHEKSTVISEGVMATPGAPTESKDPFESFTTKIKELIELKDYTTLEKEASEALESFPSQPYFYYAMGMALHNNGKSEKAVEQLEYALDYLLDDAELAYKIYSELAAVHTVLGNTIKANMYLSKLKSGS